MERHLKETEKELEWAKRATETMRSQKGSRQTDSAMDRFTKTKMSTVGREVGKVITCGITGMFKR